MTGRTGPAGVLIETEILRTTVDRVIRTSEELNDALRAAHELGIEIEARVNARPGVYVGGAYKSEPPQLSVALKARLTSP